MGLWAKAGFAAQVRNDDRLVRPEGKACLRIPIGRHGRAADVALLQAHAFAQQESAASRQELQDLAVFHAQGLGHARGGLVQQVL
jgi:hypothetical protein